MALVITSGQGREVESLAQVVCVANATCGRIPANLPCVVTSVYVEGFGQTYPSGDLGQNGLGSSKDRLADQGTSDLFRGKSESMVLLLVTTRRRKASLCRGTKGQDSAMDRQTCKTL